MKLLFIPLAFLSTIASIGQDKTPTQQEARDFFDKNKEVTSSLTYYEEDGAAFKMYSQKKPGDIIINGKEMHKVLRSKTECIYNCSMIFFDNRLQPAAEIESVQKTIMANYEAGFSFQELAERYSDPLHHTEDSTIDIENLPDCPLKSGLEQHKPNEMFLVQVSEFISYLIVINGLPIKRKGILVQHAVYE